MKIKNNFPTIQYSVIQGLFFASFGAFFVYTSVYLLGLGFTNTQIGYITSVGAIASIFFQPAMGTYADTRKKMVLRRMIIIISLVIIALAGILLSFSKNLWMIALIYGLLISFMQLALPLVFSLGMFFIDKGVNIDFGVARAIGSLGYAAGSTALGILIEKFDTDVIMYSVIILYVLIIFLISRFRFKGISEENFSSEREEAVNISLVQFLKYNKKFTGLLLGSIFLFISYNLIGSYMYQIVVYHGFGSEETGNMASWGALIELPVLFGLSQIKKKYKSGTLLKVSIFFILLRAVITYFAPSMGILYISLGTQLLGYGLFAGIYVYYVNHVIDDAYLVRGQTLMSTSMAIGKILASLLGGKLLDLYSVPTMLLVSLVAAGIGAIIMNLSIVEGK